AVALHGDHVPLAEDLQHWLQGTQSMATGTPRSALMIPGLVLGQRHELTELDLAAMYDIGWELPRSLIGDADDDADVDSADLNIVISRWTGSQDLGFGQRRFEDGDFDFDADVDSADMNLLILNWSGAQSAVEGAGMHVVPEPSSR